MQHPTPPGTTTPADSAVTADVQAFIDKWTGVSASELSTAQSFVIDLCDLLGVPLPHATDERDYMFERPITFRHGDGSTSPGRVDCYKRGHFVWESKKLKPGAKAHHGTTTKAFDDALLKARQQAENYARALPAAEGRPPFVVVVDVGHVIELYAEFTRSGATYTPFPDPRSHRIRLAQLADPALRARLKALWTDPLSLDPSRVSAKVTRAVAAELADLAKSLEAAGHRPEPVAAFLTRCLFSMFAEDVGLLPHINHPNTPLNAIDHTGSFANLLKTYREQPATLAQMLKVFWQGMDVGGFNAAIAQNVLRFNGKLFKGAGADGYVLPLTTAQIDGLLRAARANWQEVEPAIFGTLLERALDPTERHALGAHYTPRAYVERLVLPTVVEPLRADWANAQAAAVLLAREADGLEGKKREAKLEEARAELRRFHHQLCTTRVLDPACGSGNFLYVTLEHLKRLEGEVINQLEAMGETQDKLGLEGETVTLQQLRGIELNQRAAALAELVLWIGWLQWHVRTRGLSSVAEPVVHDYGNIENRDAVLAFDRAEPALGMDGQPLTRWDGVTFKPHPVTGEAVPDEAAQVVQWAYVNPRPALWPEAEFIVGNPPFIGASAMRAALGDGYAQTLRAAWPDVPESADFVMYWWHHAACVVRAGRARRFGFITTNSLRQTFNRRVVQLALDGEPLAAAAGVAGGFAVKPALDGEPLAAAAGVTGGLILPNAQKSAPGNTRYGLTPPHAQGLDSGDALGGAVLPHAQGLVAGGALGGAVSPHMQALVSGGALGGAVLPHAQGLDSGGALGGAVLPHAQALVSGGGRARVQKSVSGGGRCVLPPLSLVFAIPDHPWVDSAQGAAVRIAMSVGTCPAARPETGPAQPGRLLTVRDERASGDGEVAVTLDEQTGLLHADLRVGANVANAQALQANAGLSSPGVKLHGAGFIVTREEAAALLPLPLAGEGRGEGVLPPPPLGEGWGGGTPAKTPLIREYRNGRDLMATPRDVLVIDAFGLTAEQLRAQYPAVFQWLVERVKPERDQNNRATYRDNWWIFGEPRKDLRPALQGLPRYIATVETAKHRTFQFLDASVLPDNMLIAIATGDMAWLGVLSSQVHVEWALASGGTLEDRPRYNKSVCFETFPFPHEDTGLTPELADRIRALAEQLDAHRKARQAAFESVTLTGLYNVLDKLRRGEALNAKDKTLHEQGLVSVLQSLHDELDAAVLAAYGWSDLGAVPWRNETARAAWTEALLERLVALNKKRAAEEAAGTVRWLRPEFQDPAQRALRAQTQGTDSAAPSSSAPVAQQTGIEGVESAAEAAAEAAANEAAQADADAESRPQAAQPSASAWPSTLPEQMRAVAQLLSASPAPLPLPAIEASFKGKGPWKKGLPRILETLEALGRARQEGGGWRG